MTESSDFCEKGILEKHPAVYNQKILKWLREQKGSDSLVFVIWLLVNKGDSGKDELDQLQCVPQENVPVYVKDLALIEKLVTLIFFLTQYAKSTLVSGFLQLRQLVDSTFW